MMETWTEALGVSRERVLSAARTGRHREALLAHATAGRIVAAWTLDPAPRDPATHVEATHARTRRHLERLLEKPAGAEVRSPMTSQLYTRLTQPADPSRRTRIDYTVVESYTYTPRKPLRRVYVYDSTRSEEHTSELQSLAYLVCRLMLEKKKKKHAYTHPHTVQNRT